MGQGYVGLPLAMAAAQAGHDVIGYEPDAARQQSLADGFSFIDDVPHARLKAHLNAESYIPTRSPMALKDYNVGIIAAPTLLNGGTPDLRHVQEAAELLAAHLTEGALVVLESTIHPGATRDLLIPILEEGSGLRAGDHFHVGYSPARTDPGNPLWHFGNIPKIVSGYTMACRQLIENFYSRITQNVIIAGSLEEAELATAFESTFRYTNIALVNELGRLCHTLGGIDVWNVLELAETKPFGFMKFTPGPGVGGYCLPIGPAYIGAQIRRRAGTPFRTVELASDINEQQPAYVVSRLTAALNERSKPVKGARILALGASYKPGTADIRESPACAVIDLLRKMGAIVTVADPEVRVDALARIGDHACIMQNLPTALAATDAVVLLTAHEAFDLTQIAKKAPYVLDTRGTMPTRDNVERL